MKKKFLNISTGMIQKSGNYSDEQIEIIRYGLETIYLTFTKLLILFLLAYVLGIIREFFLLLITYNIIRSQAFGIHASKSIYCLISSIIMFIGGALICKYIMLPFWINISLAIICNICLFLYAPADTYKHPLINPKKRKRWKLLSTFLGLFYTVCIILWRDSFIVNYLIIGMIESVIMIVPITYKMFHLPYNNYKNYSSVN